MIRYGYVRGSSTYVCEKCGNKMIFPYNGLHPMKRPYGARKCDKCGWMIQKSQEEVNDKRYIL